MQDAVDIWQLLETYTILVCFRMMAPEHIFPGKNVIKSVKSERNKS